MPPANLSDDQTWQVVAYVRSLTAPAIENKAPGDAKAGEALFWGKAGCGGGQRTPGPGPRPGPEPAPNPPPPALPPIPRALVPPDAQNSHRFSPASRAPDKGKTPPRL